MNELPDSFPDDEIVTPSALEAIARADINQQIATAKRWPRTLDIHKMQERMIGMACYSTEAAAECFYAVPKAGLTLYGPSVRLSEIAAYCWGNLYAVSRIVDINPASRIVTAQAVAWDLESNVKEGIEYTQRITIKGEDGIKIATLAAIALAGRNAKLKVVPRVIWYPVYERCLATARGSAIPLGARVAEVIKAFAVFGVTIDRILSKLTYEAINQITEDDLQMLRGYYTAIKEEASSAESIFPVMGKTSTTTEPNREASSGPTPEPSASRRRGRPPGSRRNDAGDATTPSQESDDPGQPTQQGAIPPVSESIQPTSAQPPEPPEDSKAKVIAELRDLLATNQKSEPGLMAKMQEWGFAKNLDTQPITLDDYPENTLVQVAAKWEKIQDKLR